MVRTGRSVSAFPLSPCCVQNRLLDCKYTRVIEVYRSLEIALRFWGEKELSNSTLRSTEKGMVRTTRSASTCSEILVTDGTITACDGTPANNWNGYVPSVTGLLSQRTAPYRSRSYRHSVRSAP